MSALRLLQAKTTFSKALDLQSRILCSKISASSVCKNQKRNIVAGQDPWAPFEGKYTIHEESRAFAKIFTSSKPTPFYELGLEKSREYILSTFPVLSGEVEFNGEDEEIIVSSLNTLGGIPVSVYKPTSSPEAPPIFIFFHGGGLVLGARRTHASTAKAIAQEAGAIVLNVEYRLLPNSQSPYAPFDDAEVVTRWVLENKEAVGGKPNSKIGVGGDGSGGQLAIGVTNEIQGLDFQILIYPMADTSLKQDTVQEFKHAIPVDEDSLQYFFKIGCRTIPDLLTNPRINGMERTNTESSPPALIILAELDPLRGCGMDYANKLTTAGVKVQLEVIQGVPHSFYTLMNVFKTTSAQARYLTVKFLKQFW